jgi:hypothetical protein
MTLRTIYDHERNCFVLHNDKPPANAFDWKNWECPVNGKISWKAQSYSAQNSQAMTKFVEKQRETNPTHGTLFGVSEKVLSVAPPKNMKRMPHEKEELSSAVLARKPKAKRREAQKQA